VEGLQTTYEKKKPRGEREKKKGAFETPQATGFFTGRYRRERPKKLLRIAGGGGGGLNREKKAVHLGTGVDGKLRTY